MTVLNGLSNLYAGGWDLSGDVGLISRIAGGPEVLSVPTIDLRGMQRIAGRFDGSIGYNVWLNPAGAHVYLATLPTADVPMMIPIPAESAAICAMLVAKQVGYNPTFGSDLGVAFTVEALAAAGFPLEWGQLITNGKRTDTGATASGTGIDLGVPAGVSAVNITSSSVANPSVIVTATAHGLQTGDSVLIAGHTSTPTLNGGHTVTVVNATSFTVPVNVTVGGGANGTVQRTSHRGWAAQNQVFSITGTSVTVTVQDAPNNVAGEFVNVTGGAFAAVTSGAARGAERIASAAGIIQRYVRVKTTGTFNPSTFATAIYAKEG